MNTIENATIPGDDGVQVFVDVRTGRETSGGRDRTGQPLFGWDATRAWWGTEHAAWILSQQFYTVEVKGTLKGHPYTGHFIGTVKEVLQYCETHAIKVTEVLSGQFSPW